MIRNETEYQEALRRLNQDREVAARQRAALEAEGLMPAEVERAMAPLLSFQTQLAEEVDWYERVRRREFPVITRLTEIGRLLLALRIAQGLTQRGLAERRGISEALVSRDERNEYHGITVERAQRILDALNETLTTRVEEPAARTREGALVGAGTAPARTTG
jgi:DNA-directed RNA polymerase specialized sigma subunit